MPLESSTWSLGDGFGSLTCDTVPAPFGGFATNRSVRLRAPYAQVYDGGYTRVDGSCLV